MFPWGEVFTAIGSVHGTDTGYRYPLRHDRIHSSRSPQDEVCCSGTPDLYEGRLAERRAMTNGMDAKDLDLRSAAGPQLTRILRELIIGNRLKAGVRLSEADISQRFGVSRQPMRESFIKLSEEGLLEVRHQRGTFVRWISLR